jgi:hypothetical protein
LLYAENIQSLYHKIKLVLGKQITLNQK